MSAYFSAILSTADSCLMAASGNLTTDLLDRFFAGRSLKSQIRFSQFFTFVIGVVAIFIAWQMTEVLSLMLYSYAFMVSGLLVPVVAGLFFNQRNSPAAISAMISGGTLTAVLGFFTIPNLFGLTLSLITFCSITRLQKKKHIYVKAT